MAPSPETQPEQDPLISEEREARLGNLGLLLTGVGSAVFVKTVVLTDAIPSERVSEIVAGASAVAVGAGVYCLNRAAKMHDARTGAE